MKMKRLFAFTGAVMLGVGGLLGAASAAPAGKVTICKQVSTPGNSRRQSGDGTITVSANAVNNPHFSDAQGSTTGAAGCTTAVVVATAAPAASPTVAQATFTG